MKKIYKIKNIIKPITLILFLIIINSFYITTYATNVKKFGWKTTIHNTTPYKVTVEYLAAFSGCGERPNQRTCMNPYDINKRGNVCARYDLIPHSSHSYTYAWGDGFFEVRAFFCKPDGERPEKNIEVVGCLDNHDVDLGSTVDSAGSIKYTITCRNKGKPQIIKKK